MDTILKVNGKVLKIADKVANLLAQTLLTKSPSTSQWLKFESALPESLVKQIMDASKGDKIIEVEVTDKKNGKRYASPKYSNIVAKVDLAHKVATLLNSTPGWQYEIVTLEKGDGSATEDNNEDYSEF